MHAQPKYDPRETRPELGHPMPSGIEPAIAPDHPPTSSDGQTRKRKGRNSDVRKEQNRIASRAYREKRRQRLALLDEILKSESHNDSMSSVSDETEYSSTTPAPEFRAMESTSRSRIPSNSPASYYMSTIPVLAPVPTSIQPLPSNGLSRDMEAYASYSVKDYDPEPERFSRHSEYAGDPSISTIGMSSGYVSAIPPVTPVPSTPMFPFDEECMSGPFSAYPLPDGSVPDFPDSGGYDSNMINALQSLSRLNDSQQQQIVAYIQKKRGVMHSAAADHAFHPSYGGYHVPVPGRSQGTEDAMEQDRRFPGRYAPKPFP
ncbi:hypothetical protein O1611_g2736 [Lasiodiplodia mahajangana]|uniref:Uncharacterized protein n=1 Tax=Lasiodiplodia mahajangana TaxID=1108764 RepID=A0ACC2JTV5_9PEZI|nr:hypothetical protein O1611_g2736 [Lasiodiplodia mahajangana]